MGAVLPNCRIRTMGDSRIILYTREGCAYCPLVKKYLTNKKINFEIKDASGSEYEAHAKDVGFNVPLTVNTETNAKVMGWDVARLNQLIGG